MNCFLVDYGDILAPKKGFSRLFKDYTHEGQMHETLADRFFHYDYRREADYFSHLNTLSAKQFRRRELIDLLVRQNRAFGVAEKHIDTLSRLDSPQCMFVVTGQQPGLFTGPLYSIYKALTAIVVAERQKVMFPEYDFLPLFWIEGEDHDFSESASTSLFENGHIASVVLEPWNRLPEQMVCRTVMGQGITDSIDAFLSLLQESEQKEKIAETLQSFYTPESTLELAFAKTMALLFKDYPLLMLSPADPEFKKLSADVLHRELATCPHTSHSVIGQSSILENMGYEAQAKPRTVNLFLLNHHGQRMKIEDHGTDRFITTPGQYTYSRHQMLELCTDHPEQFSPNVILRPIVQDHVLPVFAYIGGPGEINYLAQYRKVYEHFGLRMPFVIPRASITLVEPPISKIMDKVLRITGRLSLSRKQVYLNAFKDLRTLQKNAVSGAENHDFDAVLDKAARNMQEELEALVPTLSNLDRNLEQVLSGSMRQVEKIIEGIRQKTHKAGRRKHDELVLQLDKAASAFFPGDVAQERAINVFYFINKYGWNVIDDCAAILRAHATESHMILEL